VEAVRWRRKQEQEPEPAAESEAWAEVLRRYRTRPSRSMKLERYKQDARRRKAERAAQTRPHTPLPPPKKSTPPPETGCPPAPAIPEQSSEQATPDFAALTPDAPGPDYDESVAGVLQRRYGSVTEEQWHW
jgi:hypothetical protein